jgi:phage tail-like protein
MNKIRKGLATMALSQRYFGAMRYSLELEGATTGLVESVEGGDATGDVATHPPGTDRIVRKHLAKVRYQDITLRVGAGMSSSVYNWIDTTLRQAYMRRNGAVVMADLDNNEVSRLNFYHAMISEIGFPALDGAGSKKSAQITLKLTPEYTRRATGSGRKLSPPRGQTVWLSSNFRLQIDGLNCSGVNRIDALTIASIQTPEQVSETRDYEKDPGYLDIPNLSITLSENGSDSFRQWYEDFVLNGNNGVNAEKNGTLEYLAPNLRDVLFTLTFRHLGIFRLTPENVEDGIRPLRAEMYCEEIDFNYGSGVVSGKSAGVATAADSAAAGGAPAGARGEDTFKYAEGAVARSPAADSAAAGGAPAGARGEDNSTAEAAASGKGADAATGKVSMTNATRWEYASLSRDVIAAPSRVGRQLKFRR